MSGICSTQIRDREKDAEPSEPCSTPTGFSRLLSSLFSSCHMEMRSLLPAITTHNMKHVSRGLAVEVFHPKTNYTTSGKAPHEQDGVPFVNAVANVALKQDRVVAFGQSFVDTTNIADSKPSVEVASVIPRVEQALDGKHNSVQPTVEYLTLQDSSIVLFHVIQVQNEAAMTWHEAYVDAHSGELVSITDFVAQASYKVLPMWKELPTEGYEILVDHQNSVASPFGWHNDGITNTTVTAGNNVITYIGAERPRQPLGQAALSSSTTHAFYVINSFHDVLYLYGFTESTFNFQTNNFDKGGLGNDRVLWGSLGKCGSFSSLHGIMQGEMLLLENDIPIHEMTHGLTNRLTGGGTVRCLQTTEVAGLGEGWSDAVVEYAFHLFAFVLTRMLNTMITGLPNPETQLVVNCDLISFKAIGEGANILHNIYATLVTERGWSSTVRTDASGSEGNVVWLQLLVGGLSLQPCNPDFTSARDA
ncbi:putative extracellular elastinolytic metalloproteinase precursor [Moniliophthora roreri]|nr:putative extracellular elastinolytic metalloproteinase precursor [Moniliophthora roreri]